MIAVSAGFEHSLALRENGTVVAWGDQAGSANFVPTNLVGVAAIAAGWNHNLALLTNGTVSAWGVNGAALDWHLIEVPGDLTNATAISAGALHSLALRSNGTVTAWGYNASGQTNVPANLSNVVAVAAGGQHSLALKRDGTVVGWGWNNSGQCNAPSGLSNVMAIAAGWEHSVALKNDGSLVAWGDNSSGQTNVPAGLLEGKLITARGDHTLVSRFSPVVQYPVDVSKDLLLIYNTNSADSIFVKDYYLAHRPMVANANVLGLNCVTDEITANLDFTNQIVTPVLNWLIANPTKPAKYIILFLDIPARLLDYPNVGSVSYALRERIPTLKPFINHINMNGTNDCKGYIDKLEFIGTNYSPGKVLLSASQGNYGNTNYVVDNIRHGADFPDNFAGDGAIVSVATNGLISNGIMPSQIIYTNGVETRTFFVTNGITNFFDSNLPHLTDVTNVAGYISWGQHSSLAADYALNGLVQWKGNSRWWIIQTIESYNGVRPLGGQGNFIRWFSSNAFGGTNYTNYQNTPVGAVTHGEDPFIAGVNHPDVYFGLWTGKRNLAICAWNSFPTGQFQAVGDPFTKR